VGWDAWRRDNKRDHRNLPSGFACRRLADQLLTLYSAATQLLARRGPTTFLSSGAQPEQIVLSVLRNSTKFMPCIARERLHFKCSKPNEQSGLVLWGISRKARWGLSLRRRSTCLFCQREDKLGQAAGIVSCDAIFLEQFREDRFDTQGADFL
jgi:hypothetical protein